MKRIFLSLLVLPLLGVLAACQSTVYPSESVYTRPEVMTAAAVQRCRVLETREVSIGATPNSQSRYGYSPVQAEETAGAIGGALVGALIGSQIGSGDGKEIATALGASLGGAAGKSYGARLAQQRQTRTGVEYSILDASGREQVIVQDFNPGDRVVRPGETCRVARGSSGLRVLPGEHLPGSVARPRQTTFH